MAKKKKNKKDKKNGKKNGKKDKKGKKGKKSKKPQAETSRYGHREGSISAFIDDLVADGTSVKKAASLISKKFKKTKDAAKKKFLAHVKYLQNKKGVAMKVNEDKGTYKAKKASL